MRFQHPCGHWDEIDERRWYDEGGDAPWLCPTCEEARQVEREANAAFLAPLQYFVHGHGPLVDRLPDPEYEAYDWEPDALEQARIAAIHGLLVDRREQAARAIDAGLAKRAAELAAAGAQHPYLPEPHTAPVQIEGLLHNLEGAYSRLHNTLWCAENGLQPWEGSEAFWLFDVEQAEERLVAELWRRVRSLQEEAADAR